MSRSTAASHVVGPAKAWTTAAQIARVQRRDGMIPWFPGWHCDPWNHVEAAMALTVGGFVDEARAAYRWLAATQHADGSWCQYYEPSDNLGGVGTGWKVKDGRLDANVTAYAATGVLHLLRATGDRDFARGMWPVVEAAIDRIVSLQQPTGEVLWCVFEDGTPATTALLTGSSSVYHSIRCAVALAEDLDHERPEWELAAGRLATALAFRPECFENKDPWAMDWYYPVLCGALRGDAGHARLAEGWDRFVVEGWGVRCVADKDWFTGAETAECAMAHMVLGEEDKGRALLEWTQQLRTGDGGYFTGLAQPAGRPYPHMERSTYTSAAIILADDCLTGTGPAAGIFRGEGLVSGFDLDLEAIAEAAVIDE